jgi:hypothetical protein
MLTLRMRALMLGGWLLLASPVTAQTFRVSIASSPTGTVLSWPQLGSNIYYSAESLASLSTGTWRSVQPADQWPVSSGTWTATGHPQRAFYRVRAHERGRVAGAAQVDSLTALQLNILFVLFGVPLTATYNVTAYSLTYETYDHRGQAVTTSGALVVPSGVTDLPLVVYMHGTVCRKSDAPSDWISLENLIGAAFASDGYAVLMPDLLGLGSGTPGIHSYMHARSEAVAGVDMLRATRSYIASNLTVSLNNQLFLTGYSHGGHSCMALHRELEQYHAAEFQVTASAPMAGPYDLSGVMRGMIIQEVAYLSPSYLPYLLLAYDSIYDFPESPLDYFVDPYTTNLPPLFDGSLTCGEIDVQLPAIPIQIIRPAYRDAFTNKVNHPLRVALRANDVYDWTPVAPIRMFHCSGDTTVPYANSLVASNQFAANGVTNMTLIDPSPGAGHVGCAIPALVAAKSWFDTLR